MRSLRALAIYAVLTVALTWPFAANLLCPPSTVEFAFRKAAQPPERIPAAAVDAMRALRAASCPGDVVMTRPLTPTVPLPVGRLGRSAQGTTP